MATGISYKHLAFIDSYFLHNQNATEAYQDVYGVQDRNVARSAAARLLANVAISGEIERRLKENTMRADEVLSRLSDIARGNITDLMDATTAGFSIELMRDGKIKPEAKLIRKIKQKVVTFSPQNGMGEDRETIETEIELYSALDALRDLGKVHSLFVERTELTGKDGGPLTWRQFIEGANADGE